MYLMPYGGDLFGELKSPFDDFSKKLMFVRNLKT